MELAFYDSCKEKIKKYKERRFVFSTKNYSNKKLQQQTKGNSILTI